MSSPAPWRELVERTRLRPDGLARRGLPEGVQRLAHRLIGPAQGARDLEAALADRAHDLTQHPPQLALPGGHVTEAHAIGRHPLAMTAEGPVEQLLLLVHEVVEAAQGLAAALFTRARHHAGAQVLEDVLKLRQQLARRLACPHLAQGARPLEHPLQLVPAHQGAVRVERRRAPLRHPHRLVGEGLEVLSHRPLQLVHQALDLLIGGVPRQGVHQGLLRRAQLAAGDGDVAVLDAERRVP